MDAVAARGRRRKWVRAAVLAAAVTGLLAVDLTQAPADQVSARLLLAAIDAYQATLSRAMPKLGVRCRFRPTCSHYAEGAIRKYGALVGGARAFGRVLRCGPWTPAGTVDWP